MVRPFPSLPIMFDLNERTRFLPALKDGVSARKEDDYQDHVVFRFRNECTAVCCVHSRVGDCRVWRVCCLQSHKRPGGNHPVEVPPAADLPVSINYPVHATTCFFLVYRISHCFSRRQRLRQRCAKTVCRLDGAPILCASILWHRG